MQHFWRQLGWTIGLTVAMIVILNTLGIFMTPDWRVEPLGEHIRVTDPNTAIKAKGLSTPQEGRYKVRTRKLTLDVSGGKQVHAIVREAEGAPAGRPACLFLHGAGTGKSEEVYGDLANAMASAGITTLVQDKRLDNYGWLDRDYEAMAQDYSAGLAALRAQPGVDNAKTGLYAESEGTWIASKLLREHPDLGFAILTSPPVYSGRQLMAMAATEYLEIIGAPDGVMGVVPKFLSMDMGVLGLDYVDFPASNYADVLSMPVLVNYGTHDPSMPVEQGAQQIFDDTRAIGNNNVTLRYYPTNHQMRTGSSLSVPNLPLDGQYTHNLEDWINAVAAGIDADGWQTPLIAGDQPFQEYAVPQQMKPGMISSFNTLIILAAIALFFWLLTVISAIAIAVTNAVRRRAKRPASSPADDAHDAAALQQSKVQYHFTPFTRGMLAVNMTATPLMALFFFAYCAYTANAALHLEDRSTQLAWGWNLLKVMVVLVIMLFAWSWVRVISNFGNIQFNHDEPRKHVRLACGHWFLMGCASLCLLIGLVFASFFSLVSF